MRHEPARAKINLFLHVGGKRADGYHDLQSLVVFANAADMLDAEESDALTLSLSGPFARDVPVDENNLVLRAARALQAELGINKGARLRLHKNLPVASGIGGGSADAAAALRLLSRLWHAECDLETLALALGSDVPVCLKSQSAWMSGRGEILHPVELPRLHLVLVNPGVAVSTREVFRSLPLQGGGLARVSYTQRLSHSHPLLTFPLQGEEFIDWLKAQRNDLEPTAQTLAPQIGDALALLRAQPGCGLARLSGSGATCFGIFADAAFARAAQAAIQAATDWWVEN